MVIHKITYDWFIDYISPSDLVCCLGLGPLWCLQQQNSRSDAFPLTALVVNLLNFFRIIFYYFMYMSVLTLCMRVHHVHAWYLTQEARRGCWSQPVNAGSGTRCSTRTVSAVSHWPLSNLLSPMMINLGCYRDLIQNHHGSLGLGMSARDSLD